MYWNNSGDYSRLMPDIDKDTPFTGTAPEADPSYVKPTFGTEEKPLYIDNGISILDSVRDQAEPDLNVAYRPFLQLSNFSIDYKQ